jgi:hypothetical protein
MSKKNAIAHEHELATNCSVAKVLILVILVWTLGQLAIAEFNYGIEKRRVFWVIEQQKIQLEEMRGGEKL